MELYVRLCRSFAHFTLPSLKKAFITVLQYSGEKRRAHLFLGTSNIIGIVLFLLGLLWSYQYLDDQYVAFSISIVCSLIALFIPFTAFYFYFYFKAEKRTKQVHEALPDVLHMIAANLRSGMTPFEAIKVTCTHDFGPLTEELTEVTSRSQGMVSFADTLLEITQRIRSEALLRSMTLFASSLRSGGHVAELLDGLAQDIIDRQALRKELVINTATNAMFIMFTILIGTPMLLAISIYFVEVVGSLQTGPGGQVSQFGLAGLGGEISITAGFLVTMSYIILFLTCVLATLFMGSMIDGEPKRGLKWAPLLVIGSYIVFFIARFLITVFLGDPLV